MLRWDFTPETEEDRAVKTRFAAKVGASGGAADPKAISHEGHRRQLADFVAAVRENRAPQVDGREGRKAVDLICAIYESNRTGKVVELPRLIALCPLLTRYRWDSCHRSSAGCSARRAPIASRRSSMPNCAGAARPANPLSTGRGSASSTPRTARRSGWSTWPTCTSSIARRRERNERPGWRGPARPWPIRWRSRTSSRTSNPTSCRRCGRDRWSSTCG